VPFALVIRYGVAASDGSPGTCTVTIARAYGAGYS